MVDTMIEGVDYRLDGLEHAAEALEARSRRGLEQARALYPEIKPGAAFWARQAREDARLARAIRRAMAAFRGES